MRLSKKYTAFVVLLFFFVQVHATAMVTASSVVVRIIKNPLVNAINKNEAINDADPFVTAVIRYLEGNEEAAAGSFVEGLIINSIQDPVQADKVLDSISGIASTVSVALTLAGKSGVAKQISDFVAAMGKSKKLDKWATAKKEGKEVAFKDGEVVVQEKKKVVVEEKEEAKDKDGYTQLREDEVLPLLNIKHGVPGAKVILDGEQVDLSKHDEYMFEDLSAGKHIIKIATKYSSGSVQVFVNPSRKTDSGYDQIELDVKWKKSKLKVDSGRKGLPVYLGDSFVGKTPLEKSIKAGEYELRIEDPWIENYSEKIDAAPEKTISINPDLVEKGALKLEGDIPRTAKVRVNGKTIESKYSPIYVKPGTYEVRIEDEKMYPFSGEVEVSAGEKKNYTPNLRFRTGTVKIKNQIGKKAKLYIDGEDVTGRFTEEGKITDVVIGEHILSLSHPIKENPITKKIELSENSTTKVTVPMGKLVVKGIDKYIDLHIQEQSSGKTLLDKRENEKKTLSHYLPTGNYRIKLEGKYIKEKEFGREVETNKEVVLNPEVKRYGIVPIKITDFQDSDKEFTVSIFKKGKDKANYHGNALTSKVRVRINLEGDLINENAYEKRVSAFLPPDTYTVEGAFEDEKATYKKTIVIKANSTNPLLEIPMHHSKQYKIAQLEKDLQAHSRKTTWGWSMMGTSVASAATAGLFYYLAAQAYSSYKDATISSEAEKYRTNAENYSNYMYVGIGTSVVSVTIGTILFLNRDERNVMENSLETLKEK